MAATTSAIVTPHPPFHRSRSELSVPIGSKHASVAPPQRLSMSHTKSLKYIYNGVPIRSTHQRYDEAAHKTQQYERMMDRFQLRRIAQPRRPSHSQTAGTTQRESKYASGSAIDAQRLPLPDGPTTEAHLSRSRRCLLAPTGVASLVRTALLLVVVLVHAVILPLRLAYVRIDPTIKRTAIVYGPLTDLAFVLNVVMVCNTATFTPRGHLVTTHRAIFRQYYRHGGLVLDVAACHPLEVVVAHLPCPRDSVVLVVRLLLRAAVAHRHRVQFQRMSTNATTENDFKWLDWLLYSRFGHLIRIGHLVLCVCLLTHYLSCVWTLLTLRHGEAVNRSPMALHLHSIYDVLQLLQGQGIETTTVAQDVFASVAVLLGSISLAVIFCHVAILIGNFSANQTAYQRKIESVFAIMEKLQLPQAIRDRVHQYYGYLHTEYESLDDEVVKFARDLSHTLELEVVLYKYMDVVVSVPHWIDCSPDFQKQLVLNVTIRVYLPDDFVIRRGEVGTSFFIVNRGICKQYQYPGSNDEFPTVPLRDSSDHASAVARLRKRPSDNKYLLRDGVSSLDSVRSLGQDATRPTTLTRGHAFGERALVANYVRTSEVRAFTYVEMCVLEREAFQLMLTLYPEDREMALSSILHHCMHQRELQGVACERMPMVRRIAPMAMLDEGVAMLVDAMSPKISDPTIVFGVTDLLEDQLVHGAASTPVRLAELTQRVDKLQSQLDRIERMLEALHGETTLAPQALPTAVEAPVPPTVARVRRPRALRPVRRGSDSVLEAPPSLLVVSTHTPYADRLFKTHAVGAANGAMKR